MTRRLTPADLADILRDTTHAQAKPPRTTAGDVAVQTLKALAAGVGASMLVGGALWLLAAPPDIIGNAAATTAVIVSGAVLLVQAVPSDKLLTVRRIQQVQAVVIDAEFRKRKAYEVIEKLEAQHAEAGREWQRAMAELRNENKVLRAENLRYKEAGKTPTFVTSSRVTEEIVKDAQVIIEHWYSTLRPNVRGEMVGEWWSRPKAVAAGWTKTRHKEACNLLIDVGIVVVNEKLPSILPTFTDAGAALYRLHTKAEQALSEPDMPRRQADYVEPD